MCRHAGRGAAGLGAPWCRTGGEHSAPCFTHAWGEHSAPYIFTPAAAGPGQHHRAEQEPAAGAGGAQGGARQDCRAGCVAGYFCLAAGCCVGARLVLALCRATCVLCDCDASLGAAAVGTSRTLSGRDAGPGKPQEQAGQNANGAPTLPSWTAEEKLDSAVKEASEATAVLQQLGPGGAQQAAAAGAAAAAAAQGATPMPEVTFNFDAAAAQARQAQQEQYLQQQQQYQQYQQQQYQAAAAAPPPPVQQPAQQQQPPQQAAPAETGPTMTVVYETGWNSAYLHFSAGGCLFAEVERYARSAGCSVGCLLARSLVRGWSSRPACTTLLLGMWLAVCMSAGCSNVPLCEVVRHACTQLAASHASVARQFRLQLCCRPTACLSLNCCHTLFSCRQARRDASSRRKPTRGASQTAAH